MADEKKLLSERLKTETRTNHDSVDSLVMSVNPFANEENYIKFLQLQAAFHKIVDDVYHDSTLNQKIPHLSELARYQAVIQDLADLGAKECPPKASFQIPKGNKAIGWLYCAEGSNLGAAFLFKEVKKIDMDENRGAHHLAPHKDGRGKHWREFVKYLNSLGLDESAENEAINGAKDAFATYKVILREIFNLPNP